jgi:hypothetical protein
MQRRRRSERDVERFGIHRRDPLRVEPDDPPAELERARERLLEGHLLIEGEPDQERERVADEEPVGGLVTGERESVDRRPGADGRTPRPARPAAGDASRLNSPGPTGSRPAGTSGAPRVDLDAFVVPDGPGRQPVGDIGPPSRRRIGVVRGAT